jgi:hypothetical protein
MIEDNKYLLTIKDFDNLEWHDCKIYGLAFDDVAYKFYLDIDFILEWIKPLNEDEGYKFKIAPATLIYHNAWDVRFDIDTNLSLDIDSISMKNPHSPKNNAVLPDTLEYDWVIELQQGAISFKSIGFELYIRKSPVINQMQTLGLIERGGISFSAKPS